MNLTYRLFGINPKPETLNEVYDIVKKKNLGRMDIEVGAEYTEGETFVGMPCRVYTLYTEFRVNGIKAREHAPKEYRLESKEKFLRESTDLKVFALEMRSKLKSEGIESKLFIQGKELDNKTEREILKEARRLNLIDSKKEKSLIQK